MSKRNKMPGLRLKGDIWHIQKRSKYAQGGWLRESTQVSSRTEAEKILIRRLAQLEEYATRRSNAIFIFEEAAMRYLEDIAHKRSVDAMAFHIDQLLPFIGYMELEQIHDTTLKPFIGHEKARGLSPKSINNALGVVSTVMNRAARVWRTEEGIPWLRQAPPRITRLSVKGKQSKSYPLSWAEQDRLVDELPTHLKSAVLYAVNTGCREQEVCQLEWSMEFKLEAGQSIFVLPETLTKTETERVVVLNSVAAKVIEERRGIHPQYVFSYEGKPLKKLRASAWRRAWEAAGLPTYKGVLKGVHNLRHTFGRRLRAAGIALETRKALLGHANGDITTHYSIAEIRELEEACEKIVNRNIVQTPTLYMVSNKKCSQNVVNKNRVNA